MITILLADPQTLTRLTIYHILSGLDKFKVVDWCELDCELIKAIEQVTPQLLITDYCADKSVPLHTLQEIRKRFPKLNILIVSSDDNEPSILKALSIGVESFITKNCNEEEVINAVLATAKGEKFYCSKIIEVIHGRHFRTADTSSIKLSKRETQVLIAIAKGQSSVEIAQSLHVSLHTINSHRKNIIKKLGIRSPTEFVVYASEMGLIQLSHRSSSIN